MYLLVLKKEYSPTRSSQLAFQFIFFFSSSIKEQRINLFISAYSSSSYLIKIIYHIKKENRKYSNQLKSKNEVLVIIYLNTLLLPHCSTSCTYSLSCYKISIFLQHLRYVRFGDLHQNNQTFLVKIFQGNGTHMLKHPLRR